MNAQQSKKGIRYCPFDGSLLSQSKYCQKCDKQVSIQNKRPRKPRNFYEAMPEGIEDNYVDELFLKGLVHKNSFPDLHYPAMIRETLEIVHVINTMVYMIVSFEFLLKCSYEEEIFITVLIGGLICYAVFIWIHRQKYNFYFIVNDLKTAIFLTGILLFLTPVLKSLTVTYSDDTIILFVVIFCILHLILYDYRMVKRPVVFENITQSVGSPTSLNAIIFATILLSSRLDKVRQVYVLLFQSMILFGFFPLFRQSLRNYASGVSDALSVLSSVLNFFFIFQISQLYASLYLVFVIFITMVSPLIFIYAYQFKNDIQGPWDLPKIMQYHTLE